MNIRAVDSRIMIPLLAWVLVAIVGPTAIVRAQATAPDLVRVYAGATTAPAASVVVQPATAGVQPGASVQFTATVTGTANSAVTWSATGGTISSTGLFTAGTSTGTFSVKATVVGGTIAGTASVSISGAQSEIGIDPGTDIQAQINAQPAGTAFRLRAGMHRLSQPLTPKNGNRFVGEAGAMVSGARRLTAFTASGSHWRIDGQTQQGQVHGTCLTGFARCAYPEDLYIDNVMLRHVATLQELAPGRWHFDYANDTIYIADNPSGRVVETTVVPYAFGGAASEVTIAGLVVEKFANRAQLGAISGDESYRWAVRDNEVRFNHGVGIRVGHGMVVTGNQVHHNGQLGVGGVGDNVRVEANTIAYSNVAGFDYGWEGGGTKFVKTRNLLVRNNWVHHNTGPGLWLDIDNIDFVIEGNTTEDNSGTVAATPGIMIEISYGGVIRSNTVRRNGLGYPGWVWGAGILVAASGGAGLEIHGNSVEGNADGITLAQQNRGAGAYGPYYVQNVAVHDNVIRMSAGHTGAAQDVGDNAIFSTRNNRFYNNQYYLGANSRYFSWMNGERTDSEWRSYGNDISGVFTR